MRKREKHTKTKKNFTNRQALVPLAFGIVALSAASAHAATVIYSDSFGRTGTLDGSAPDTAPGSETWFAHALWTTDGAEAKHLGTSGAVYGNHAMLPFTPEAGNIYRLKAELDANAANAGWFVGIGFYPSLYKGPTESSNGWPTNANPLLHESYNGWKAFMPLGGATSPVAQGTATAGVAELYAIELDTTASLWTVSFFVHGNSTPVYSTTYTTNPTIGAVGIITWAPSADGKAAFVDNFELSVIPEPSSSLLFTMIGTLALLRRSRR
jgi:hypothetical protein